MTSIGISLGTAFVTEGPGSFRAGVISALAQARAAARAGLDSLTVGDHHATGPGGYVQNTPLVGRLLAEWQDRPAGCLFLVPLWHPVLMAEQIATLATLATTGTGPFIVQAAVGGGSHQFAAMGVDIGRRGLLTEESIGVVQDLLAGETVVSEQFGIDGARIAPLPPEGTEWWIGGAAPRAIDRAARLGDCWYGNADLTAESALPLLETYREACARHGRQPARLPIRKDVLIAESNAEAERAGNRMVASGYRGFDRGAVAYGDPDRVAEQLAPFFQMGFTDVIIRPMAPLPPELGLGAVERSVELAGELKSRFG